MTRADPSPVHLIEDQACKCYRVFVGAIEVFCGDHHTARQMRSRLSGELRRFAVQHYTPRRYTDRETP